MCRPKNGEAFAAWTDGGTLDEYLPGERASSVPGSCVTRGTYCYRNYCDPRTELRMRIPKIAQARMRYGYRKIRVLLNREGWEVGKHLVYRLYQEEGLALKRMNPAGRRKAVRHREEKFKPTASNEA